MPRLKYRNPVTGEYEALDVEGKVPKELSVQVEKNAKVVGELKADLDQMTVLLTAVRDALKDGRIDDAISLLDTFLLDEGVLE